MRARYCLLSFNPGDDLLSAAVTRAVPWASSGVLWITAKHPLLRQEWIYRAHAAIQAAMLGASDFIRFDPLPTAMRPHGNRTSNSTMANRPAPSPALASPDYSAYRNQSGARAGKGWW
jgi:hypothetical protein